jgi:hypothetical protein
VDAPHQRLRTRLLAHGRVGGRGRANLDSFALGEVIPEWRLVPNDNNIGKRNVHPVAGGGGAEGLLQSLNGVSLWVGNPNPRRARMTLHAELSPLLADGGWRLSFPGLTEFPLPPGARREVALRLDPGQDFAPEAVTAGRHMRRPGHGPPTATCSAA